MSDDNNFSLGDILWEYADYTPPEPDPVPAVPLPPVPPQAPDKPAPPAAPVRETIPAPQPAAPKPAAPRPAPAKPAPPPPAPPKPAAGQKQTPYLPANQGPQTSKPAPAAPPVQPPPSQTPPPKPPQQEPPKAAPAPAAAPPKAAPTQEAAPAAQPEASAPAQETPAPKTEQQPAPEGAAGSTPQTGVPQDDGPDLIAFTPDPSAKPEASGEGQPAPEGQPETQEAQGEGAEQAQPGEQAQPQPGQEQTPPGPQPGPQPGSQPGPQPGPQRPRPAGPETQSRRERKPRPEPQVPPDAPPGQLAQEYSQGLGSLKGRCIGAALVSVLLLALAFLEGSEIAALSGLFPQELFLPVGMALFVVAAVLCWDVLKDGLIQLTNKAPNGDTLALFAAVFTLLDGVTLLAVHLRTDTLPFFAPCGLVLTFHLLGRYLTQSARFQACRVASSVAQPYLVTQDENLISSQSAFRKWIGTPRGFGSQVRTMSDGEFRFQRLTPVLLTACVVLSLITTVAHHQPRLAFWSLSALFSAASTLGVGMALSLPQRLLGNKLAKLGAALAGWPGIVAGKGCKAAMLHDYDIYPPGTITLVTARPFGNFSMERAVSFAASVVRASGSGLTYLFDKVLHQEHGAYVAVEKLVMQENGLMGQSQGQEILVGNSDFMSRQGIALPPGIRAKDAVFCAVGREIAGMFVLKYTMHPSIIPSLKALFTHRLHPILVTRDFNLNPHRLRLRGRLPVDQISFPDLQRRVTLSGPNQTHSSTIVAVLCREGLAPFAQSIIGARRIRRAAKANSFLVNISACIGVFLTASLSSAGALGAMSAWNLSLFLLLWLLPVVFVSLWTKQY